jgi:hypothetical protein
MTKIDEIRGLVDEIHGVMVLKHFMLKGSMGSNEEMMHDKVSRINELLDDMER